MSSLITSDTKIRVSSTLNRDVRSYGKQYLTDASEETCWNSDQGTPQHITLDFPVPVSLVSLCLMFQGGFVGRDCEVLGVPEEREKEEEEEWDEVVVEGASSWEKVADFYPADHNHLQVFDLRPPGAAGEGLEGLEGSGRRWKRVRIVFKNTTDFYGRVTVYRLDLIGTSGA
ncbi:Nuclear receptor 2C2-associated protein [Thoreauomyces humboldtii]|nr:Nuclear receptor 2C2-associated protein [Thoreauomyces humboldtii]